MEIITSNFKLINKIIDIELYKVIYQDRSDIKQEILCKLCRVADREHISYIKALTRLICRASICDYYRYKSRVDTYITPAQQNHHVEQIGAAGVAHELVELKVDYEDNRSLFSPGERQVMDHILYNQDDYSMSPREVAAITGIHKSTISRAMKKLRCLYSPAF